MSRLGGTGPAPAAPAARPAPPAGPAAWTQLELRAPGDSRHFDARHWAASRINGEALALTRRIASGLAATRGWNARIVIETGRALAVVLADHAPGDLIAWSQLPPALHRRDLSIARTAEILDLAGLLDDDRISSFTALTRARLALLPPPMAADVGHWLRTRSQGGPRSRPRDEHTVRMNLNRVHPLLLAWAGHYTHLREVTAADIITATGLLPASLRRQTLTALRSLFGHCQQDRHDLPRPHPRRPRRPAAPDPHPAAAARPDRPGHLRRRHTRRPPRGRPGRRARRQAQDHPGASSRRRRPGQPAAGHRGPGPPARRPDQNLLLAWLQHRGRRWPGTANPHLIINQQTAMTTRAVSENWLTESCRGLTATLERLRVDRQLEEALTCGADPLHLAAVFGIGNGTAIKYATIARQLLPTAAEQHDPSSSREPRGPEQPIEREDPSVHAADPSVRANSGQSPARPPHPPCASPRNGRSTGSLSCYAAASAAARLAHGVGMFAARQR